MSDPKISIARIKAADEIIHINDVDEKDFSGNDRSANHEKYICLGCEGLLYPRSFNSAYQRRHFVHEQDSNCDPDGRLHTECEEALIIAAKRKERDICVMGTCSHCGKEKSIKIKTSDIVRAEKECAYEGINRKSDVTVFFENKRVDLEIRVTHAVDEDQGRIEQKNARLEKD